MDQTKTLVDMLLNNDPMVLKVVLRAKVRRILEVLETQSFVTNVVQSFPLNGLASVVFVAIVGYSQSSVQF
jgi:hypothetical protein